MRCKGITKAGKPCRNDHSVCRYHGAGLKEVYHKYAPSFLKPKGGYTKAFENYLKNNGDEQIVKIQVGRKAINPIIKKALNVLSLGKFGKTEKKLGEDALHSYLLITTRNKDGSFKVKKIEKNHTIEVKDPKADDYQNLYQVPIKKPININTLINNAKNGDKEFSHYDPKFRNCQTFVKDVIDNNKGAIQITDPKVKMIIEPQNSTELINSLGILEPLPKAVTDTASVLENIKQSLPIIGNGRRKHKLDLKLKRKFNIR